MLYGGPSFVITAVPPDLECADLAEPNAAGDIGGDGQVDIGDLNFFSCVLATYPGFSGSCMPTTFSGSSNAEILISVNGSPWDGSSFVEPNDLIEVTWYENDATWYGGFSNFNLNVSSGDYQNDFSTITGSGLSSLSAASNGQGGIDVSGGLYQFPSTESNIFSFRFRVPLDSAPSEIISIQPTQGSWRCVPYDQLPSVTLTVSAECVNPPLYDFSGDCKVNFVDLAMFLTGWLDCGLEPNEFCWQ
jgi:hypothetical protein